MTKIDKEQILTIIDEGHGVSINTICVKLPGKYAAVYKYVKELMDEKRVVKVGLSKRTRYYPADYDRTQHNEFDNIPIVVKKTKKEEKPVFNPSPLSPIGKALEIPADLKAYTVEEGPDDDDPDGIGEPVPIEPIPEPVPARQKANADDILKAINQLEGVLPTGTEADDLILRAKEVLEKELTLESCPFCGATPALLCTDGRYRVECACGSMFAFAKSTRSAADTITMYNQRVRA